MPKLLLPVLLILLVVHWGQAQQNRTPYTSSNAIFINMEGHKGTYDFASRRLMVRYNENTMKMECVLQLGSLVSANDSTPVVMAHEVFFSSRYPDIYIEIDAPVDRINAARGNPLTLNSRVIITIQGIRKEMVTPVTFTPDRNSIAFSSSFDVLFTDMRLKIPAQYVPMLTGRMLFTIHNAHWADIKTR